MNSRKTKIRIDRRSFLQSAAATAGLALSPMVLGRTEAEKKPDDINVALLGAGVQGQVLMNSCLKIRGIRIRAVCDIWERYNQKRASRILKAYRHDHNTYVDYREMIDKEKDLDAVIIATPDFWHAEQTVDCLNAGLHAYCETAMSNTIEGARKMAEAAERTGKLLQIGCQRRSNPRYIHCYEKLLRNNKVLGRIAAVSGQWNRLVMGPLAWPERVALDQATLERYGYESMARFRNWRWYRGLGGGPVVDLGSHQIDVFNWFLRANPVSIIASGRTSYLDKYTHQWYDTVMAVYEYETDQGPVSAYYQILSHNRYENFFEKFMGGRGTLIITEFSSRPMVYPELMNSDVNEWAGFIKEGRLNASEDIMRKMDKLSIDQLVKLLIVSETPPNWRLRNPGFNLPVEMNKPYHQPHLENFFDAIRGRVMLNCPAEIGYKTAVAVLKINEAVQAGRKLKLNPDEYIVHNKYKERIERILGVKLPESVRNCRHTYKSYGMSGGICWGFFELSGPDLQYLLDASDYLPDSSEFGKNQYKVNIKKYLERTGESITWWKPLTLRNRQYDQKVIGGENITEIFELIMHPVINICIGEIRDDWMGVYFTYHVG